MFLGCWVVLLELNVVCQERLYIHSPEATGLFQNFLSYQNSPMSCKSVHFNESLVLYILYSMIKEL